MIVMHNSLVRFDNNHSNFGWGLTLVTRECLEKYASLLPWVSRADYATIPNNRKLSDESAFAHRVLQQGGNYIKIDGIIKPIYHLDNGEYL